MKLGIPRALLYYDHAPLWSTLLEGLGFELVISPPTNKAILDLGVNRAPDEACLPVKICYGHLAALEEKVDALFLPRMVSERPKTFFCPKLMGLPDMVRPELAAELFSPLVDLRRGKRELIRQLSDTLDRGQRQVREALGFAERSLNRFLKKMQEEKLAPLEALAGRSLRRKASQRQIGLLGHPYLLYDSFLNMGLISFLEERGFFPLTAQMLPPQQIQRCAEKLPKKLFWSMEAEIMGSAIAFLEEQVMGIIHISSFACGPDAMIGELISLRAKQSGTPLLELNLDEQTGQAGLQTRLEAFLDMLQRRCPA